MICLRVQHESGEIETIELEWPVYLVPATATLWRLKDANGVEHFFTQNGYYDGLGAYISEEDQELMTALTQYLQGRTKSFDDVKRALTKGTIH